MPLNFLVIALNKSDHSQSTVIGRGKLWCLSCALSLGMVSLQLRGQRQDPRSPRSPGSLGRAHAPTPLAKPLSRGPAGPQPPALAGCGADLPGAIAIGRWGYRAEPAGQTRRLTAYRALSTCASKLSEPPHGGPSVHVFVLSASSVP